MDKPTKREWFIGDPCYAVGHKGNDWMTFVAPALKETDRKAVFKTDGAMFASTAYGDGVYLGSDGISYPVDAGLIGCVPKEQWGEGVTSEELMKCGKVVTSSHVTLDVASLGELCFEGDSFYIVINTNDDDEEYEEDEEDEEDEDDWY